MVNATLLRHALNIWPPFLFTGIHVTQLDKQYQSAKVELRLRPWNRNYMGTHFGGSLFAMTDPFWMLLVLQRLGKEYIVWDKLGEIDFVLPGKGLVYAEFKLDESVLQTIRDAASNGQKVLHWFETDILDKEQKVIAKIRKQVYIRKKILK